MSEVSAYEKMLQDGTAFKKIDMTQHTMPSIAEAQGAGSLGERVENLDNKDILNDRNDNYEDFDNAMENRINSLRSRMKGGNVELKNIGKIKTPAMKEIEALKKRMEKLEEVLMMVMEVQQQLFE